MMSHVVEATDSIHHPFNGQFSITICMSSLFSLFLQQNTFSYSSPYWQNKLSLDVYEGMQRFSRKEFKLNTFFNVPFTEMCLVFRTGSGKRLQTRPVLLSLREEVASLYDVISKKTPTRVLGSNAHSKWEEVLSSGRQAGLLQRNCGLQGFNVKAKMFDHARVRIGILGNNEHDCYSCDSYIGVGGAGNGCDCHNEECHVSAGGADFCSRQTKTAFVTILVQ